MSSERFVARREYFGCLVYDREAHDYIPFDQEATEIFRETFKESLDSIYFKRSESVTRQSFDTFIQLCESIGLLQGGTFQGRFLETPTVEGLQQLSAPTQIHLQLTQYCNLSCRHCWASAGQPREVELTLVELRKLAKEMADIGALKIRFGGGEPLGRSDIVEVIKVFNEHGISISMSTNASLITKAMAKKLVGLDIYEWKISMDAASEKTYDYLRGDRAYRKALRGLDNLRDIVGATNIYFHTALHRENVTEIPALIKLGESKQVQKMVFDLVIPAGRAANLKRLVLSAEDATNALDLVRRIGQSARVKVEIPTRVPPVYQTKHIYEGFGSSEGILSLHIASDGRVSPSGPMLERLEAGNIKESSLLEIWKDHKVFRALRQNPGNTTCQSCSYFSSCRGGSRTRATVILGSLTERDPFCSLQEES